MSLLALLELTVMRFFLTPKLHTAHRSQGELALKPKSRNNESAIVDVLIHPGSASFVLLLNRKVSTWSARFSLINDRKLLGR